LTTESVYFSYFHFACLPC